MPARKRSQPELERAHELAAGGDFQGAEEAYRRAGEGGDATALAHAGVFAEARGEMREAADAYHRADEAGDGFGALRLGFLLSSAGDWAGAESAWKRADERGHEQPVDLPALLRGRGRPETQPKSGEGSRSVLANPVLVGAVTVLALLIAVFLAYSANQGLPFVPTKELKVNVANGAQLVIGNDVREGGFRVGLISDMRPVPLGNGQVGAQLVLKLDKSNGSVPVDSTATIVPRSVLGLKYVQLNIGHSTQSFADGGTLPITHTSVPVQFDDVFKTFDSKTRVAIQRDLVGFGNTLAARGSALNDTIASLPSLLTHLRSVAGYLSQSQSGLIRFFNSLNGFMGAVAPVAQVNARLFGDMATTFGAIARDPSALEATIRESPSTLDVSTRSLIAQQPFLSDLAVFGRYMTPATASLRDALPQINPAIEAGTRTLIRTPALNSRLQGVMVALRDLARAPGTNIALNGLSSTVSILNPMIRYLGPYQTVCDDWNYFWTYLSEHLSEQTRYGFAQRAMLNFGDATQTNNVGQQGATAPVNGGPEYLHSQSYGAAISNSGAADCETGQRGYVKRLNYFDPQHRNLGVDIHTPGLQGPTFQGRPRVPAGETFSRAPQTGPQPVPNPTNP